MTELTEEIIGITKSGDRIRAYTLDNGHIKVRLSNYGAAIMNLWVPDKNGDMADIVLGYDRAEQYFDNPCNFGVFVGPSANRIAKGEVPIDGKIFQMPQNEGENNLHTDAGCGIHKMAWDAEAFGDNVTFTLNIEDGRYNLPGNRTMMVSYNLTADNALHIACFGTTDKKTIFNPTNHSYFNLAGEGGGSVLRHDLLLNCSSYTPTDDALIPTGKLRGVEGTEYDFRQKRPIAQSYDINYCIDGYEDGKKLLFAAALEDPDSGRIMEVWTSLPGVQLYTAEHVDEPNGKNGHHYEAFSGVCLETQYFPDAVHHEKFADPLTEAGASYTSVTEYRFCV